MESNIDANDLITELKKTQEILSEERIRQIVREEIEKRQKQQIVAIRAQGFQRDYEVK